MSAAVRRMKLDGLLRLRRAAIHRRALHAQQLTEHDLAEVERFKRYLVDAASGKPLAQLVELHGAAYLGFTEAEARAIAEEAATVAAQLDEIETCALQLRQAADAIAQAEPDDVGDESIHHYSRGGDCS